jgi:hypothetical protein
VNKYTTLILVNGDYSIFSNNSKQNRTMFKMEEHLSVIREVIKWFNEFEIIIKFKNKADAEK